MLTSQTVFSCIANNYSSYQFNVNSLAYLLQTSPATLRSRVKLLTGISPQKLIELYRVLKIIQLHRTQLNWLLICKSTGYECTRTFHRNFKDITGISFSEFQTQTIAVQDDESYYIKVTTDIPNKVGLHNTIISDFVSDFVSDFGCS